MKLTTLSLATVGAMVSAYPHSSDEFSTSCAMFPHLGTSDPSTWTYEIKFDSSVAGCYTFENNIKSIAHSSYSCEPIQGLSGVHILLDVKETDFIHDTIVSALDATWPEIAFKSHGYCDLATGRSRRGEEVVTPRESVQPAPGTAGNCIRRNHQNSENLLDYEVGMDINWEGSNCGKGGNIEKTITSNIPGADPNTWDCKEITTGFHQGGIFVTFTADKDDKSRDAVVTALKMAYPMLLIDACFDAVTEPDVVTPRRGIEKRDEPMTDGECLVYRHSGLDDLMDYEVTMNSIMWEGANCGKDTIIMKIVTSATGADPNTWNCVPHSGGIMMTFTAGGDEASQLAVVPALKMAYPTVLINQGQGYCAPRVAPPPTIKERDDYPTAGECLVYSHPGSDSLLDYEVTIHSDNYWDAKLCVKNGMEMNVLEENAGADPNTWNCEVYKDRLFMTFTANADEASQNAILYCINGVWPTALINQGQGYCAPRTRPGPGK